MKIFLCSLVGLLTGCDSLIDNGAVANIGNVPSDPTNLIAPVLQVNCTDNYMSGNSFKPTVNCENITVYCSLDETDIDNDYTSWSKQYPNSIILDTKNLTLYQEVNSATNVYIKTFNMKSFNGNCGIRYINYTGINDVEITFLQSK